MPAGHVGFCAGSAAGSIAGAARAGPAAACRPPPAAGRAARGPAAAPAADRAPRPRDLPAASRSMPLLQAQVPAPLADAHRGDQPRHAGRDVQSAHRSTASRHPARRARRPAAVAGTARRPRRSPAGRRGRSARILPWFCQIANGRRSTSCTTIVSGRRRSTVACSTQDSFSIALARRHRARSRGSDRPCRRRARRAAAAPACWRGPR